jgi:hypothetical protein
MQRFVVSTIVFVCVILIFDMMANEARLTRGLYWSLRVAAERFDNYAGGVATYLTRG